MTRLERIIRQQIDRFGPMSVAEYMTLCLLHPEHGYYTTRTTLGISGDFITAPEISQMFGEMLGLCLGQAWLDQGRPDRFLLAELGPGRGTLMADICRVAERIPGFSDAAEIWLVEVSPKLRDAQKSALSGHAVNWADSLSDLPEAPLWLVANEFFDALPIHQYRLGEKGWQEQMIDHKDGQLGFSLGAAIPSGSLTVPGGEQLKSGAIREACPAAVALAAELGARIARHGGVALILDYGDWGTHGDTFQAVARHEKTGPLVDPGNADLTAHVDFSALAEAAHPALATGMTTQGTFLERLGITARAQALAAGLSGAELETHIAAHRRLTHPGEMGSLFKAIGIYGKDSPPPPGFDHNAS